MEAGFDAGYLRLLATAIASNYMPARSRYGEDAQVAIRLHVADVVVGKSLLTQGVPFRQAMAATSWHKVISLASVYQTHLQLTPGKHTSKAPSDYMRQYNHNVEEGWSACTTLSRITISSSHEEIDARRRSRGEASHRSVHRPTKTG